MGKLTVRYAPRRGTAENKRNSGFTLVEMLLTTAILVILLGLSMVAVVRWRDPLKITELDNAAREIYMAAENRSVLLQGSGAAAARLSSSGSKLPFFYVDDEGKPVTVTPDDEDKYVKMTPVVLSNDDIGDMLPAGSIEPKLWDGHFYVLYDEKTHHVFEVFYAEEEFSKDTLDALRDKSRSERIRLFRRVEGNNINCLVGYYGGGLVDRSELKRLPKPGVEVLIENGNQLTLTVKYTMPADLPAGVTVTREPIVTLEYGTEDPVNLLDSSFSSRLTKKDEKDITLGFMEAEYTWVLDSLVQDGSGNFTQQFKGLFPEPDPDDPTTIIVFGGDFTVTARLKLSADGYIGSGDGKNDFVTDTNNSLFDQGSSGETVYIKNLRHLQNLDSDSSGAAGKKYAVQTTDIDAGTFKGADYKFIPIINWDLFGYRTQRFGEETKPCLIRNLRVTPTSAAGKYGAGLFGIAQVDFEFQDIYVDRPKIDGGAGQPAAALLGYSWNPAIFKNCQVVYAKVNGGGAAGGMLGDGSAATFSNCAVKDVSIDSKSSHAGGLAGNMLDTFDFTSCQAINAKITGGGVAGGIAGYTWSGTINFKACIVENSLTIDGSSVGGIMGSEGVGDEKKPSTITLTNCKVGEDGSAINLNGRENAGGLVGSTDGIAEFAGCVVGKSESEEKTVVITAGTYAGGLVGNSANDKNQLTECKVFKAKVSTSGGTSEAGGLVGRATQAFFATCSANSTDVEGVMNAGGLVGGAIGGSLSECETDKVTVTANNFAGGLVGNESDGGALTNCKAVNTKVTALKDASEAGGLVGRTRSTNLRGCQVYWSWNDNKKPLLTGTDDYKVTAVTAGGLVGAVRSGGMIESSFAATLVKGTTYAGGLVGSLPAEKTTVTITKSYADCYIEAGPDVKNPLQIPYAGGLIGIKETSVQLKLENVYATGFINMIEEGQAAGLCGGWVAEGVKYELTAQNAYAAIHYETPGAGYPLACTADYSGCMNNCYSLESNWGGLNMTHAAMSNIPMGDTFEKKSAADSHPYKLDGQTRGTYPFPGLKDLPHYGDWPTS